MNKNKIIERTWFSMMGAAVMFLVMSFYMTSNYGRMVNHIDCNHSITNLKTE